MHPSPAPLAPLQSPHTLYRHSHGPNAAPTCRICPPPHGAHPPNAISPSSPSPCALTVLFPNSTLPTALSHTDPATQTPPSPTLTSRTNNNMAAPGQLLPCMPSACTVAAAEAPLRRGVEIAAWGAGASLPGGGRSLPVDAPCRAVDAMGADGCGRLQGLLVGQLERAARQRFRGKVRNPHA